MSRVILLSGFCLGLLSLLTLYFFFRAAEGIPTPAMGAPLGEEPPEHVAPIPGQPVPVDNEIRLPDGVPEIASAEEAQALAAWWAGHNSTAVALLQKFHTYGLTQGWRLRVMHAHGGGYLVRFLDGDTIRGFARFWPNLRLWQAGGGDAHEAATAISAAEVAEVTLACWRLLQVNPAALNDMEDDLPTFPAEGWTRECGNWLNETSVIDTEDASRRSWSGRRLAISIGDDGVLRDFSMRRVGDYGIRRVCGTSSYAGKSGDAAEEPSPPIANN